MLRGGCHQHYGLVSHLIPGCFPAQVSPEQLHKSLRNSSQVRTGITEGTDPQIQGLSFEPLGQQKKLEMVLFPALSPECPAGDLTSVFLPQLCPQAIWKGMGHTENTAVVAPPAALCSGLRAEDLGSEQLPAFDPQPLKPSSLRDTFQTAPKNFSAVGSFCSQGSFRRNYLESCEDAV